MFDESDPRNYSLDDLAQRCEQETKLYFNRREHDSRYCFELFRRAIQGGDSSVWDNIYPCYSGLVASWVKQHSGFESSGERVEYFVNGAFAKLSITLTRDRFQGFTNLGSLLSYLKLCVHSVIVDHHRAEEQPGQLPIGEVTEKPSHDASPEDQVIARTSREEIWKRVMERLHDEKERRVIQGLIVFDLKPRELYEQFPTMFTNVDEIYTVKQNVKTRLRRDPEIRKLLGLND